MISCGRGDRFVGYSNIRSSIFHEQLKDINWTTPTRNCTSQYFLSDFQVQPVALLKNHGVVKLYYRNHDIFAKWIVGTHLVK